jgi:hypothetical protein
MWEDSGFATHILRNTIHHYGKKKIMEKTDHARKCQIMNTKRIFTSINKIKNKIWGWGGDWIHSTQDTAPMAGSSQHTNEKVS